MVLFSAQILIIVACVSGFAWLLTINQVPATIMNWILSLNTSAWMPLLVIKVLLLAMGCFLDSRSSILLLTPLLGLRAVCANVQAAIPYPPRGVMCDLAIAVAPFGTELKTRSFVPLHSSRILLMSRRVVKSLPGWRVQFAVILEDGCVNSGCRQKRRVDAIAFRGNSSARKGAAKGQGHAFRASRS
jgi:hypothetical protein